jgi:hypothetical protein
MPLYDDCRWRAQNVPIHDNDFRIDPAALKCTEGSAGARRC